MPLYDYHCLYCGNCDSALAGLDDHMTLCSQCGSLMLRSDDEFSWQFFDGNQNQFTQMPQCDPVPSTGVATFSDSIPPGLNFRQHRSSQLGKGPPRVNLPLRKESPLLWACRAKIFCDKELRRDMPDPQQPERL
jgi:hypothetical protein